MDMRSGPFIFGVAVAFVAFVAFIVPFNPGTGVELTNGMNEGVEDTVEFPGSFFGWATHPDASIHPIVIRMVSRTIFFTAGSPFL